MMRKVRISVSAVSIWFGLLIIYIVSSYLAQDVLLPSKVNSVLLYVFLGYSALMIVSSKQKLTTIIVWQITFLLLALVAMTYSPKFAIFSGTYYALIVNFVLVYVFSQMPWTENRVNSIFNVYIFSAVALIIALVFTGNLEDRTGRLGEELFGNANTLAMMLMVSAIFCMWFLVIERRTKSKVLYIIMLSVIYFGLFLSGGRKYIVIPVVFLYFLLLKRTNKKGRLFIIRSTIIIAVIFIILYKLMMEIPDLYNRIGYRFEGFFGLYNDEYEVDGSTNKRMMMIRAAWEQWFQKPLLGHGLDSFKYYNATDVTGRRYYSHNNYVELLYNQGLVGFLAYYSFYIALLAKTAKKRKNTYAAEFAVAIVISLMIFEFGAVTYNATPNLFLLFFAHIKLKLEDEEVALNEIKRGDACQLSERQSNY